MKKFGFIIGLISLVWAEDYAVIVGIDRYAQEGVSHLSGAKNDAVAYQKLLLLSGVKKSNIKILTNEDATKKNIQKALIWVEGSVDGDDRFYYFHAGHGTSLRDNRDILDASVLRNINKTGILLPYDYKGGDLNSVLVTQKDLRPYFERIDRNVSFGLLTFDACYAGYSFRGISLVENEKLVAREQKEIYLPKKFNLGKTVVKYPYENIYSLTSSDNNHKSFEDPIEKRGIFSMALEKCVKENIVTKKEGLKICLDREYLRQVYKFKPANSFGNPIFFKLKKSQLITTLTIRTDGNFQEFSNLANFVKRGVHDLELNYKKGLYRLNDGFGILINEFKNKNEVRKYLSNYRFIHKKGKKGNNIDVQIGDKDFLTIGSKFPITINSSKKGFLAIFSINQEGNLYMLEPVDRYIYTNSYKRKKDNGYEVEAPIGTDFLKVIFFEEENSLNKLKVENTGKLLNDKEQIDTLLSTLKNSKFSEKTLKIRIIK